MKKLIFIALAVAALCSCSTQSKILSKSTYDKAVFEEQYKLNKAEWDAAFAFLSRKDLNTLKLGEKYMITDKTSAKITEITTRTSGTWEAHRKVVDFFYCFGGTEKVGVATLNDVKGVKRAYTDARDVETYETAENVKWVVLDAGKSVILFPSDAHLPNQANGEPGYLKVATIKVPFVKK